MVFKMCHYLIGLFNFLHKIYKYIIRAYFFRLYFLCKNNWHIIYTLFYTLLLEMLYRKMFMYLCKESQIKLVPTILSYNEFMTMLEFKYLEEGIGVEEQSSNSCMPSYCIVLWWILTEGYEAEAISISIGPSLRRIYFGLQAQSK